MSRAGTLSVCAVPYDVTREDGTYVLRYRDLRPEPDEPLVFLPGIQGLLPPKYDRVDGLSLPVGVGFSSPTGLARLQLDATYRSRLGTVDPGATLTITPSHRLPLEARRSRHTRTDDDCIYSDPVTSLTSFFGGVDTRNYFRS